MLRIVALLSLLRKLCLSDPPRIRIMSASMATSGPVPMANPMSALASAGVSRHRKKQIPEALIFKGFRDFKFG